MRILIVGFGDIGERVGRLLARRYLVSALVRTPERAADARSVGIRPIFGDLSEPVTLNRMTGLADVVFHFAPPPGNGQHDVHTRNLISALGRHSFQQGNAAIGRRAAMLSQGCPKRLIYISTTGVYGDCAGAMIDETRATNPQSARAVRRVDAEQVLRAWGAANGTSVSILRAPGIYASDRLPLDRLKRGTPALAASEDVFTNHIHAEDLARLSVVAMLRAKPGRVYNAVDNSQMRMGEYFDYVADAFRLQRPRRITRSQAASEISPALLSFMSESRRIRNKRIVRELGFRFLFPTVEVGVDAISANIATRVLGKSG